MSISHKCIKCSSPYEDEDVDDYYCSPCNEERKRIAKEVDAKLATRVSRQVNSLFSEKDFKGKSGRKFFNAKALGIKF